MRFVIQRVMHSKVTINGEVRGQIGKGFMVLIGVGEEDTVEVFCLFPSSHYMLTVKEETDLPL